MHIVYLCHYFYPEMGAPAARVLEHSLEWVKMGHQVTVVTCFPNHPTGIIPKNYRGRFFMREDYQGIRVFRNFVLAAPNQGVFRRTVCHLSFMFSAVLFSLPRLGRVDIIIASSPTFFAGFAALIISRLKRIPFVFEVRDLWPAAIAQLEVVKPGLLIRILESWELYLYGCAQKIVVVTQSYKTNLMARGVPEAKIEVIYNGVDLERFQVDSGNIKQKYGLANRFVILYCGAIGISHSLETIIELAGGWHDERMLFLFVGEGAMKAKLQEMAESMNLKNVVFWPGQPREIMPEIYGLADICLVSLKKVPLFTQVIPSKIFEIMAAGRPMIAALEGEAAQILQSSGSAVIVPQGDPASLKSVIQDLYDNPALRNEKGQNGLRYVARNYDRRQLAGQYEKLLQSVYDAQFPGRKHRPTIRIPRRPSM